MFASEGFACRIVFPSLTVAMPELVASLAMLAPLELELPLRVQLVRVRTPLPEKEPSFMMPPARVGAELPLSVLLLIVTGALPELLLLYMPAPKRGELTVIGLLLT